MKLTRSTIHLLFNCYQSPVLLALIALRLGIRVESPSTLPLKVKR